jgi:hypothetical protein
MTGIWRISSGIPFYICSRRQQTKRAEKGNKHIFGQISFLKREELGLLDFCAVLPL